LATSCWSLPWLGYQQLKLFNDESLAIASRVKVSVSGTIDPNLVLLHSRFMSGREPR
jgi:hypothetical protein